MADVIAEYEEAVVADDGSIWAARACARRIDGHKEGWIEFIPMTRGESPVRTPVETTQSDDDALQQWASGITVAYLEGALDRARMRPAIVVGEVAPPLFDTPAPTIGRAGVAAAPRPTPVLDPFAVHAQGEQRLLDQLAALETDLIRDIVVAYDIASLDTAFVSTRAELIAHIIDAVRARESRI